MGSEFQGPGRVRQDVPQNGETGSERAGGEDGEEIRRAANPDLFLGWLAQPQTTSGNLAAVGRVLERAVK